METESTIVIRSKEQNVHKNLAWHVGCDEPTAPAFRVVLTRIFHLILMQQLNPIKEIKCQGTVYQGKPYGEISWATKNRWDALDKGNKIHWEQDMNSPSHAPRKR